jgi:hypothetical protein
MLDTAQVPSRRGSRSPSPEVVGTMANAAASAELAMRAAVGAASVEALSRSVRRHPVLSLAFATGLGYLLGGGGWRRAPRGTVVD